MGTVTNNPFFENAAHFRPGGAAVDGWGEAGIPRTATVSQERIALLLEKGLLVTEPIAEFVD
jgi:hypothetical protein